MTQLYPPLVTDGQQHQWLLRAQMSSCLRQSSLLAVTFWGLSSASDQRLAAAASSAFTGAAVGVQVSTIASCKEPVRSENLFPFSHKINQLIENTADAKLVQMIEYVWCCLGRTRKTMVERKAQASSTEWRFLPPGCCTLRFLISVLLC